MSSKASQGSKARPCFENKQKAGGGGRELLLLCLLQSKHLGSQQKEPSCSSMALDVYFLEESTVSVYLLLCSCPPSSWPAMDGNDSMGQRLMVTSA